jgi:hypothetical protein
VTVDLSRRDALETAAVNLGNAVLALTLWQRTAELRSEAPDLRPLLGYGFPTLLATLPYFLNFRVDRGHHDQRRTRPLRRGCWLTVLPVLTTITHLALPRIAGGGETRAPGHVRLGATAAVVVALAHVVISPYRRAAGLR